MDKLISALTAGAVTLILTTGIAVAADQPRPDQEPVPLASESPPSGPPSVITGTEKEKRSEEYSATLKKCDYMKAGERQKCVEAANRKFGLM
jgi:hypothetical protein